MVGFIGSHLNTRCLYSTKEKKWEAKSCIGCKIGLARQIVFSCHMIQ